ncbi:MAG: NAD(P)-dependent oxidoreductase [Proteobacteria bacterium]|jgi:3-hydroxyisobutyrate dehydrogenase|nr:NAD(P)-dependent oxidoreductase [Alphaproteobacteria bacterium]MBL6850331.1 NAD(P)-dependent oxidoreductase [Alphaproteobacteria bacterium]MDA0917071.1 NAD(P)-dependent oxidoreductase [Pseudomonadota bacterium]
MNIKKVGFIGLGAMGSVMSPLLVKAGYEVYGYDIRANIDQSSGVKQLDTLDDFAQLDAIILMLPNSKIVSEVVNKLLEINTKSILIDMSSSDPRETKKLGKTIEAKGLKFLDAPVSGGVARAKTGDLMIMAGGEEEGLEVVKDLLSVMGTVQFAGPLGSGHAIKALNNYVSAAGLIASFEALATARSFGIKPENFLKIINGATGKNNTTEVKLDKFVVSEKFNSGFALDLMVKDVSIADSLIKDLSSENPLSNNVLKYLSSTLQALGGNPDHTEVYKIIKK